MTSPTRPINTSHPPVSSQSAMVDTPARPSPPYDTLFIYYLEGRPHISRNQMGSDFIGNWFEDGFSFLFFSKPAQTIVTALLARQPHLQQIDHYQMSYAQWQGDRFTRMEIGAFTLLPPWEMPKDMDLGMQADSPRKVVILDPGVVFGNGLHPTTRDCLEAISIAYHANPNDTVLDIGTGTGVLGLAAARIGFPRVLAVDNNFLAAETARRNVDLNRLQDRMLVVQGLAQNFIDLAGELVVTNIHFDIMRLLIGSDGFRAKKRFILSGLMASQFQKIKGQLERSSIRLERTWSRDGIWFTCLCAHAANFQS